MVFRATLCFHVFAIRRYLLVDVFRNRRAADEGGALDAVVFEQGINRIDAPIDELQDPIRETSLVNEFDYPSRGEWVLLAGFEDEAVPVAMTYGRNHSSIMPGKFNGVIATNTPRAAGPRSRRSPARRSEAFPPASQRDSTATSTFSIMRRSLLHALQ